MLDTEGDMEREQHIELLRAIRSMNGNGNGNRSHDGMRGVVLAVCSIAAVCITIMGSAMAISKEISTFEGEMREWKQATSARLDRDETRAAENERLLFEKLKPVP